MKRMLMVVFLMGVAAGLVRADDVGTDGNLPVPRKNEEGALINLDASRASGRIDELQRRVSDLERDNRYQDDRIRSLERSVDDLRRSR